LLFAVSGRSPGVAGSPGLSEALQGLEFGLHANTPEEVERALAEKYLDGPNAHCADSKIAQLKSSQDGLVVLKYCKNLRSFLTVKKVFKKCGGTIQTEDNLSERIVNNLGNFDGERFDKIDCSNIRSLREQIDQITEPGKRAAFNLLEDKIISGAVANGRRQLNLFEAAFPSSGQRGAIDPQAVVGEINDHVARMNRIAVGARTGLTAMGRPNLTAEFMEQHDQYSAAYATATMSTYGLLFETPTFKNKVGEYRQAGVGIVSGAIFGDGLVLVRNPADPRRAEYTIKRHASLPSGAEGAAILKNAAEDAKRIIRDEMGLLEEMAEAKRRGEESGSRTQDQRYDDLKKLFRTNPAHVAGALLENPELAYYACSVLEAIRKHDENKQAWDRRWKTTFIIGGGAALVVMTGGAAALVAGAGLGAASVTAGTIVTAAGVQTTIAAAGAVATVAGAAGTINTANEMRASYNSQQRYRGSIATGGGDEQTVRAMNEELKKFNEGAAELGLQGAMSAVGVAGAARAAGRIAGSAGRGLQNARQSMRDLTAALRALRDGGGLGGFDSKSSADEMASLFDKIKGSSGELLKKFSGVLRDLKSPQQVRAFWDRFKKAYAGCL
ncbi:MAG TPA: hypothetical protein VFV50_18445, partial [Bdellovibrionales bacterium]|nr:hypothetical protein [Bdellovibrionales bacterium]